MTKHQVSDERMAFDLGVQRPTISRLRREKEVPSLRLAARIQAYTDGQVPTKEWAGLIPVDDVVPYEPDAASP